MNANNQIDIILQKLHNNMPMKNEMIVDRVQNNGGEVIFKNEHKAMIDRKDHVISMAWNKGDVVVSSESKSKYDTGSGLLDCLSVTHFSNMTQQNSVEGSWFCKGPRP